MSWGPRAQMGYRARKMATRAMKQQHRRRSGKPTSFSSHFSSSRPASARPVIASTPPHLRKSLSPPRFSTHRPLIHPDRDRDEVYARKAGATLVWTLLAWPVFFFLPHLSFIAALLLPVILVEFIVWIVYQYQYQAAKDARLDSNPVPRFASSRVAPEDVRPMTNDQIALLLRQAGSSRDEFNQSEEALSTVSRHQEQVPPEAVNRSWQQPKQSQKQWKKKSSDEDRLDREMRWRQDMKHGKIPKEETEKEPDHVGLRVDIAEEQAIKRQSQSEHQEQEVETPLALKFPNCIDQEREILLRQLEQQIQQGLPARMSQSE